MDMGNPLQRFQIEKERQADCFTIPGPRRFSANYHVVILIIRNGGERENIPIGRRPSQWLAFVRSAVDLRKRQVQESFRSNTLLIVVRISLA